MNGVQLVKPSLKSLPGFVDALERGWSRDNIGLEKTIRSDLAWIARDAAGFSIDCCISSTVGTCRSSRTG